MAILATKCPMCGGPHEIVKVVSWPLRKPGNDVPDYTGRFKLAGVNAEGEVCCSYDDYRYNTREEADKHAANWGRRDLIHLATEREAEAQAVTDDHGYFFDYGPVDSYPDY